MTNPNFGQQQQPQQPQAPQQGLANPNLRIQYGDRNFPEELWGRTIKDAMNYYNIMRQDFLSRQQQLVQPQPQQPQAPQYQPQQPAQQFQRPQQPQQPTPQGGQLFDEAAVRRIVQESVAAAIQPLQGPSQQQVYQNVRMKFRDWNLYDSEIQASLQDAEPGSLLNPGVWEAAYYFVKGKKLSEAPELPQPTGGDPFNRDGRGPRGEMITQPPAFPQQQQFFVEGPTAPANSGAGTAMADPNDDLMARRFGVSVEEYRRWKGGQVPPMQQPQQQQPQQPQGGGNNGWR
jgi:hypothetical protein